MSCNLHQWDWLLSSSLIIWLCHWYGHITVPLSGCCIRYQVSYFHLSSPCHGFGTVPWSGHLINFRMPNIPFNHLCHVNGYITIPLLGRSVNYWVCNIPLNWLHCIAQRISSIPYIPIPFIKLTLMYGKRKFYEGPMTPRLPPLPLKIGLPILLHHQRFFHEPLPISPPSLRIWRTSCIVLEDWLHHSWDLQFLTGCPPPPTNPNPPRANEQTLCKCKVKPSRADGWENVFYRDYQSMGLSIQSGRLRSRKIFRWGQVNSTAYQNLLNSFKAHLLQFC